jgi:hypothetical protein
MTGTSTARPTWAIRPGGAVSAVAAHATGTTTKTRSPTLRMTDRIAAVDTTAFRTPP